MRGRIARQLEWYQRQLDRRAVPKYCTFSSKNSCCQLCSLPFKVGHMLVQAYLTDSRDVPCEWVHVKCCQLIITGEGHDNVLRWRRQGGQQ